MEEDGPFRERGWRRDPFWQEGVREGGEGEGEEGEGEKEKATGMDERR